MAFGKSAIVLGLIAAAAAPAMAQAPAGSAETRYCLRVEPGTGSRVERVRCWTRQEWTWQGVDVDKDWPREGVRTLG